MTRPMQLTRQSGTALVGALRETITELRAEVVSLEREASGHYDALAERQVIAQAMGLLMSMAGCDADRALMLLVDRSHAHDRSLHEVAASIVALHDDNLI